MTKRDERLRIALDVSQIAVWDWDVEAKSVFYSQQWKLLRGIGGDEGYGCPDGLLNLVHPDDKSDRESGKAQWLEGRQDQFQSEYRVKHTNGSWVRISERVKVFRDRDGNACRIVGAETEVPQSHSSQPNSNLDVSRFATLADDLPLALLRFEGGKCVYANKHWSKITERSIESALGDGYLESVHPDDLPRLKERLLASEDSFETRHLMPNGNIKWVLMQTAEMFDTDRSVKGHLATLTDISNFREAAENLRVTKDRLQLVIEGTSVGIFEFYPSDGKLIWDDRMLKIHGVSREEFTGTSEDFYRQLSHTDLQRHKKEYEQLLEDGNFTSEFQIAWPNGEKRHVLTEQIVLRNDQNEIDKIVGLCIDVTHQRTTQRALYETKNQLQVMTDNIPSMLYRYVRYSDGSHELPFVSSGSRDVYEVDPVDAIDDCNNIFQRIHPDDLALVDNMIIESFQDLNRFDVEYRVILPEKGLRWVHAMSNPARRDDDGAVVWDGLVIDITQRKEAEIELQKAKMKDEFLANVSHELRTPLNAMLGMTEGLQEGVFGPVTAKQLESLKIIEHSGDHLLGLINEMLDLAKVESGQLKLVFSPVEVRELFETSLRMIAHQAGVKNIQLDLDVPSGVPKINLDEQRIRQVLINLLGNAVKFTPDGGSVSVKVERIPPDEKYRKGRYRQRSPIRELVLMPPCLICCLCRLSKSTVLLIVITKEQDWVLP